MASSSQMLLLVITCCSTLTMSRPPVPASSFSLVWCYWSGHTALSGGGDTCPHGSMMGPCGTVCLKSDGEMCGGVEDSYGVCGPGLTCVDNKCQ